MKNNEIHETYKKPLNKNEKNNEKTMKSMKSRYTTIKNLNKTGKN